MESSLPVIASEDDNRIKSTEKWPGCKQSSGLFLDIFSQTGTDTFLFGWNMQILLLRLGSTVQI